MEVGKRGTDRDSYIAAGYLVSVRLKNLRASTLTLLCTSSLSISSGSAQSERATTLPQRLHLARNVCYRPRVDVGKRLVIFRADDDADRNLDFSQTGLRHDRPEHRGNRECCPDSCIAE